MAKDNQDLSRKFFISNLVFRFLQFFAQVGVFERKLLPGDVEIVDDSLRLVESSLKYWSVKLCYSNHGAIISSNETHELLE